MRRARALAALAALAAAFAGTAAAADPESGRTVAEVVFSPRAGLGPYRFADLVAVRPGQPLAPGLLERNRRLLLQTGLFAEVSAELREETAGPVVAFTVQPHPLVREVQVRGNFLVLERDLTQVLRMRVAEPFREEIARGDVERLRRHYEEQGYEGTLVRLEVARGDGEVTVTYRVREGRPQVVREVVVRGNSGVEEREVLGALGISRYTFFRGAELQRGLDRLRDHYQQRGFLDVRVGSQVTGSEDPLAFLAVLTNPIKGILTLGPGGYRPVTVVVDIVEGRRYDVTIRGASVVAEDDLRELLTFSRTGFFDEEEVAAGRERILAHYQDRGYYLAEVAVRADYVAGTVEYTVLEGEPVAVGEVALRGFTHFGEGWVRERLETRAGPVEEAGPLRAGALEADRRRIESWYREAGFPQVEVPPVEVWPEAGPAGAAVTFTVREGARTLVRSVSVDGAGALAPERVRREAGVAAGEPYRAGDLQRAAERIRTAYARAGYPGTTVTVRPDFAADRAAVDLRVILAEGRPQRLGAVVVTGNGATSRAVIVRELPLREGDPLDPEALARAKLALYDLGLFREVRYLFPETVAPGDPQDLVIAVRERPTGFFGFGAGYASDERFRGFVEAGQQNLFGTGRGLRWKSKLSTLGSRHDIFYQEPWLLGADYNGQADLYLEERDEPGYDVRRRGLTLGVNRELASRLLLNLRYRYEFVNYSNVVPELVAELGPLESLNITSLAAVLEYDRRDHPILPRRGSFHQASVEYARPFLGGDTSFTKYQVESALFLPLGSAAEFALGLRGGFTQLLLGAGDLPLSERFFLGGDRTIRGYGYREVGPQDAGGTPLGGNAYALGNLELRFTLRKKLRGVLFCDAGELWANQADLAPSGLKASVGAGLRYETLVGPIRLDWGYKLDREPGEGASRWHLTIGYPF